MKEQPKDNVKVKKSRKNKWRNSEADTPQEVIVKKNVVRDG